MGGAKSKQTDSVSSNGEVNNNVLINENLSWGVVGNC